MGMLQNVVVEVGGEVGLIPDAMVFETAWQSTREQRLGDWLLLVALI